MEGYAIRPLTSDDELLLWDMLYQALVGGDASAPPRDIVAQPEFARYVEGWGRPGDRGFVALNPEGKEPFGAVWFRPPAEGATPELAFAVPPIHRRRGIGAALLTQWVRANPDQSEVSLRVAPHHPAVRLYERFGFKLVDQAEQRVTLRREV